MRIFYDIISNSQMFSDAFPMREVDDIVYEVDCKLIQMKLGADVDIGAHPSTEEQDEEPEETVGVNDVAHSFSLHMIPFDKRTYRMHLANYMKAIKSHLQETDPGRVQEFEKKSNVYAKKILDNLSSFEFYVGTSWDSDSMIALLNYREDGVTPFFTFWKDGLRAVDC
ncbi:Translationally-controlled tumor protein [Aspergillus arachidicola]|uniref:Translationally-controlled tumor protein homolog n=1 Tax=Aspergillus arachidicola TaxID=656916 RepID=A0A2G7FJF1_9EURO|nr:Translationally-controlled tumor protein [Aspergillus arachidicola]PIG80738.1 hypothetical protein AARAC_006520 [Aspergillus arachidicola]